MSEQHLRETCSCGATFNFRTGYQPYLIKAVMTWRAEHRHEQPHRIPEVDFPPIPQGTQAVIEKAEQVDHDTRSPLGFAGRAVS